MNALNEIEPDLQPLLGRLNRNIYDFLDNASLLRLRRVAVVTKVPLGKLVEAQKVVRKLRVGALYEQDLHSAHKHQPNLVPVLEAGLLRVQCS